MDEFAFSRTDSRSIMSQIKHQEQQLWLKRRWLLDSPVAESKHDTAEIPDFLNSECLSESLLREDDIFYETVKSRVEEAFGIWDNEEVHNAVQQNKSSVFANEVIRMLGMSLDALSNKGLYLIAVIMTGGSVAFEKTRPKLKEAIRDFIAKDFRKVFGDGKSDVLKQLHNVLGDPGNFRKTSTMNLFPTFQSQRDAAIKVLNKLECLSIQTLIAMKRKLEGSRIIPQLKPREKSCSNRRHLIKQVRQASEKMLSELSEEDKLQEPLAKAMSLVNLALKLDPERKCVASADFFQFTPETTHLQNEILKAICLLHKKVRFPELKRIQLLLGQEANISNDSLRSAIRKMLIEYLFECSDMDPIPDFLPKVLALINGSSRSVEHRLFPGEVVEEEVECILNASAQVKEVLWEWFPDYELDQDFDDAYMEEFEDSDDENFISYDNDELVSGSNKCRKLQGRDSRDYITGSFDPDHEESSAECTVSESGASNCGSNQRVLSSSADRNAIINFTESVTRVQPSSLDVTPMSSELRLVKVRHNLDMSRCKIKVEMDQVEEAIRIESENKFGSRSLSSIRSMKTDHEEEQKPPPRRQNQYLTVQEVSDETSMVAYNLVGHLLEKFADGKGLELGENDRAYLGGGDSTFRGNEGGGKKSDGSVFVGVVKELMPSIDRSVLMRLEELMDV
ncbi:PREDICTED: uncharacterized protein LOC104805724 [Tarenaya hassleriana]|uniref:uncharacterized protein LOC104805724 n=1 Tax=Tarenaya hassleriana TaxID=28532 RepID=UPI00053C8ABE|nr:PREDICTED: uncharacterized protein LOC104805724 [Tarenaya hassleriana]